MKTFRKVLWVAAFLVSELALTGCKFGWWVNDYRPHMIPLVIPPKSRVYVQPLPIKPRETEPNLLTPWKGQGPALEPTPIGPAEAPTPTVEPNKPSSLERERKVKRTNKEVLA